MPSLRYVFQRNRFAVSFIQTELAVDSHQELNLPYVDPFTARSRRISKSGKQEQLKQKNHELFSKFCDVIRKKDAFLKKATDAELEGIFSRLSHSERLKYTNPDIPSPSPKKRPSDVSMKSEKKAKKEKKEKKVKKEKRDTFIDDEVEEEFDDFLSSDDVSLVSESENELMDEPEEEQKPKKVKKEKRPSEPTVSAPKKFAWT